MKKVLALTVLALFLLGACFVRAQKKPSGKGELYRMAQETFRAAFENESVRTVFGLDEEEAEAVFSDDSAGYAL